MAETVTATITVLMTDLVGSTRLLRHGPEAYDEIRRAHFDAVRAVIADCRGDEVKSTGDGVMATFTSAADAVLAAIGVQQAVSLLQRRDPRSPAVRVGIGCGEATSEDGDWYGPPVIEAARLCNDAQPGQILATSVARAVVGSRGGHGFVSLGERNLKGFDEPVGVVEVTWEQPGADIGPLAPAAELAASGFIVGRGEELERLRAAWKDATSGRRRGVFVGGEPGVGKTRLVAELAREAHADGATVLWGRCDEDLGLPYQPFAEAIRHWMATGGGTATEGVDRAGLARMLPELDQTVPQLNLPSATDPDAERVRLFEAVASLVLREAGERPVLLVIDDAHWAGAPTLLLLRHLLRDARPAPVLIAATYRDTELDRTHPLADALADLRRTGEVERVALSGLSEDAVVDFIHAAAGHVVGAEVAHLARAIHAETEGNAFFVGQVLRHLAETAALVEENGRWSLSRPLAEVGIPEGVREVVGRRLSRLSERANHVLAVAAVVGREFDLSTVEPAVDADSDAVLDAVEEAVHAHLVDELVGQPGRFSFAHALVRQTLLAELTAARRARLHRKIGEALASRHGVPAAVVAHHLCEGATAGVVDEVAVWCVRAMQECWVQLAIEEGVKVGERALQVLELSDDPEHAARAQVLTMFSRVQQFSGDTTTAKSSGDGAIVAARAAGDPVIFADAVSARYLWARAGVPEPNADADFREALAVLGDRDPLLKARLLVLWALERSVSESVGIAALDQALEGVEAARQCDDVATQVLALFTLATVAQGSPRVEIQRAAAEEMSAVIERANVQGSTHDLDLARIQFPSSAQLGDRPGLERAIATASETAKLPAVGNVPHVIVEMWRGAVALAEGRLDDAQRHADGMLSLVGLDPNFQNSWASLSMSIARARGTVGELVPLIEEAIRRTPDLVALRAVLIDALVHAQRSEEARAMFDEMVADDLAAVPRDVVWSSVLALLVNAAVALEVRQAAAVLRPHVEPFAAQMIVVAWGVSFQGAADKFLGMLDLLEGDPVAAVARLEAALALEERLGFTLLAEETRQWLARARATHDA
jgi:pentatricopeptide repeat protein